MMIYSAFPIILMIVMFVMDSMEIKTAVKIVLELQQKILVAFVMVIMIV